MRLLVFYVQTFYGFPGIVTWMFCNFQVTLPGNQLISGYCYPEVLQLPGNTTQKLENIQVLLARGWILQKKTQFF